MKLFFYDLETTGVKHWRNGIHQISGAISIDGEVKEKFNFKVRPHPRAEIDEEALNIGNVTLEQIMGYPPMGVVYKQILSMLDRYADKYNKKDKFHLVGYNIAAFDNNFFRAFFVQNGDNYFGSWFYPDCLDVYILASNKLKEVRNQLPSFKQFQVAKYFGIEIDESKLHDAEYDIDICMKLYEFVK